MTKLPFVPHIAALPHLVPFVGPETMARARGKPFRARLGANENSFGPSTRAVDAMRAACAENWQYSDPENFELRSAIAAFHGVPPACVMVGEGIDGLLGLACMMFVAPGDAVVTTLGAYPTFNFHAQAHGGALSLVAMRDDREDLGALLDSARRRAAKLLYVSNPNSPMGSWWAGGDIENLLSELPGGTMLLLDEAYVETAPAGTAPPINVSVPNIIRLRTFSKANGLAGARIGYALAHEDVIAAFDKVRNHYGINRVGQIGALAALRDQDHLAFSVREIARARDRIARAATAAGLEPIASAASFVAIDCGGDGAFAKRVLDELIARDVFVRKPVVPVLERCIRVSCGCNADLDIFCEVFPRALAAAEKGRTS